MFFKSLGLEGHVLTNRIQTAKNIQPRPQSFSLKKWLGPPYPFFEGKTLGTRLKNILLHLAKRKNVLHFYSKTELTWSP